MKEDFLFGAMLVGSVVFMLVVVTCTIIVIAMQSRELERKKRMTKIALTLGIFRF